MFSAADRAQLAELGIAADEVERQLRLFAEPPPSPYLDRPCTVDDGIRVLDEAERHAALGAYEAAARAGRLQKFVPASGAATRMFQALLAARERPGRIDRAALAADAAADPLAHEVVTFVDHLDRFAFADALRAALARSGSDLGRLLREDGDRRPLLDAVLDRPGLNYAALPKALIAFHRYPDGARTAFEEHLDEGTHYARDGEGVARLHFTVSPEHRGDFAAELARASAACERRRDARLAVEFSSQQRATDTIAAEPSNQPFRTADGRLLFRPGGHGALIENLQQLAGDVIFIKTVDNVQPEHLRAATLTWMRLLTGHLVSLQAALFQHLETLQASTGPNAAGRARRFASQAFGIELDGAAAAADLQAALDRPLRVCGVVRNTGEPGGGPFWVRAAGGGCPVQIVESAQVDANHPGQRAVFAAATHFNPVFMACGVRDWRGQPFDLRRFVDPSAVFIARKSKDGRELQALERPGLWNGAMARWHTVFVEVPLETFTPVKTVNDLLRPAHQPPAAGSA